MSAGQAEDEHGSSGAAAGLMLCGLVLLALNLPFYYFCTYHYGRAGARAVHSEQRNRHDAGREEDRTADAGAATLSAAAAFGRVLPGRVVQADTLPHEVQAGGLRRLRAQIESA